MRTTVSRQSIFTTLRQQPLVCLLMLCFCMAACTEPKDTLIAKKVAERVTEFQKRKKETCRINLFEQAEKIVDSLLLAEAQQALQDSLGRLRPFRPQQPPAVLPIDSLAIQPIFKGEPKQ